MSQTPISEIKNKYKKRKVALIFIYILFFIILVVVLFSTYINYADNIITALFLLIIAVSVITPEISEYDLIRFHLNELITFLNERNPTKSKHHINKLAHTIKELNQTTDNSFIFNSTKSTLNNFWNLLKYNIYSCLKDNDYNSYISILIEINNSFDNENLTNLNQTIDGVIIDISEHDNQNAILFPYEQPHFLKQNFEDLINKCKTLFNKNLIFRFISLSIIFLIIGYCTSTISSFVIYDFELFRTIILVSGTLAVGWGLQKQ
ncbi:MAG: hypothetical protein KAT05_04315 [Spirochaetes bacterium]|nr:hypothetical protein [Spirochaetota bacterium]